MLTYGPRLVNSPYKFKADLAAKKAGKPGRYDGETVLHMAIVNRDYPLVRFLCEHGADLSARCYGTFFNGPAEEEVAKTYQRQVKAGAR